MFPLRSIFFPGETVPLHIFEDRYKQLIQDCRDEAITFGIPVYINDTFSYGTEVQLVEIVNTYDSGEMDVTCVARQVFKMITFENQLKNKPYSGGEVAFLENIYDVDHTFKIEILGLIETLYNLMSVPFTPIEVDKFHSHILIHKMGLSFEQEYELLQIERESGRLTYIKNHLISTIAVLEEVNRTKHTIKLNGDFKNFDPLDFEGFTLN